MKKDASSDNIYFSSQGDAKLPAAIQRSQHKTKSMCKIATCEKGNVDSL